MTRRDFLRLGAMTLPAAAAAQCYLVEPTALRVREMRLKDSSINCRFVHFSDFHHKGNTRYAAKMVRTINGLAPEFVCFTGDLVEENKYTTEALGFIRQIKAPVYGIPGNHDY